MIVFKFCICGGKVLLLFTREHCFVKNELKSLDFSEKLGGFFCCSKNIVLATNMVWNFFVGYLVC